MAIVNGTTKIIQSTSDGSDSAVLEIGGGGDTSNTRGAYLQLYGNENATTGAVVLATGSVSSSNLDLISNATTGSLRFFTNAAQRWSIPETGHFLPVTTNTYDIGSTSLFIRTLYGGTSLVYTATGYLIAADTADASDSKYLLLAGGGSGAVSRGAAIQINGNETTVGNGGNGNIYVYSGNASGANVYLQVFSTDGAINFNTNNNTQRWTINSSGHFVPATTNTYDIGASATTVRSLFVTAVRLSNNNYLQWRNAANSADFSIMRVNSSDETEVNTASAINFQVNGSNKWILNSSGHWVPGANITYDIGTSGTRVRDVYTSLVDVSDASTGNNISVIASTNGSFAANHFLINATRAGNAAYNFIAATSNANGDVEFKVDGAGAVTADGTYTSPADYAEYFETSTGETIEIGKCVVFDGTTGKIREYNSETDAASDIFGVTRPKKGAAAIVGNVSLRWHSKYLKNDFGGYILDENGDRQLNPDYDPELEYISREDRDEWVLIGLLGQIPVLASETKHPSWKKMKDINETVELYLVK